MRPKTIHKTILKQDFTTLPNPMLRDTRLSLRARGLLAMMLSHKDDWETNFNWLCEQTPDSLDGEGPSAIRRAVKELEALGYLRKEKVKNEFGKFDTVIWYWNDSPNSQIPKFGKPNSGNRHTKKNQEKEERSEKKDQKGGFVPKHTRSWVPKYSYPESEEEMYSILEIRGVETFPDHDGNFYEDFSRRGWCMPDGTPVYDWVETYKSRVATCAPKPHPKPKHRQHFYTGGGF